MVGWSSRNRRREPSAPCPCNNVCLCHKPTEDHWDIYALYFIGFTLLICLPFLLSYIPNHSVEKRHIEVNGQDCIIEKKIDGVSSTGAEYGHDIAVCPTDIK